METTEAVDIKVEIEKIEFGCPPKKKQKRGPGFICVFCNKFFKGTTDERIHIRRHIKERPFTCSICDYTACAVTDISTHLRRTHASSHVQCIDPDCHIVFKSKYAMLVHHKHIHLGQPSKISCEICGKCFKQQGTLVSHRRLHTGEKPYSCEVCGREFTQKSNRDTHSRVHTGGKRFQCNTCHKWFGAKQYLKVHLEKLICAPPPEMFDCEVCEAKFISKNHLKDHRKLTGHEVSDQKSDFRKRKAMSASTSKMLQQQELERLGSGRINMDKSSKLSCEICGKCFKHLGSLLYHRRIHTGEKPYSCAVCDRVFTQKSNRDTHYRVHTGEKRFQCNTCHKWFTTKHRLQVHLEKLICAPPPELFDCEVCDAKFLSKNHLKDHRKLTGHKAPDQKSGTKKRKAMSASTSKMLQQQQLA